MYVDINILHRKKDSIILHLIIFNDNPAFNIVYFFVAKYKSEFCQHGEKDKMYINLQRS